MDLGSASELNEARLWEWRSAKLRVPLAGLPAASAIC